MINGSFYKEYRVKFCILIVMFIIIFFGSFMIGRYSILPSDLFRMFPAKILEILQAGSVTGNISFIKELSINHTWDNASETVMFQIRFPRVLAATLIGGALSIAGVSYQGMFRNPMVSPDILGASSGAGFGAALSILMGASYFGISIFAFIFGLIAVGVAYLIGKFSRTSVTLGMILAGMMVGSLFSASTSFVKLVADTEDALPAITYWLMGSLTSIKPEDMWFAIPIILGTIPLFLLRWRINLMTMGDEEARSMGINTSAIRVIVIVCATLLTASSVAVSGMIGWVGLVIPHFCRMIFGYDYRILIPTSIMFGASFLIIVDNIARLVTTAELPIGILTAFIGAPLFMYLIITGGVLRREH